MGQNDLIGDSPQMDQNGLIGDCPQQIAQMDRSEPSPPKQVFAEQEQQMKADPENSQCD